MANITSADISKTFQRNQLIINAPESKKTIKDQIVAYRTQDIKLLSTARPCPVGDSLRGKFPYLESKSVVDLVTKQFYNVDVIKAAVCAVDSVLYMPPSETGGLSMNDKVHLYFQRIRQIGGESVEGYASSISFGVADNAFVLKAPRNPADDNLAHEAVVGMFGTNQLRAEIPNFAYIFGYMRCSPPLFDQKRPITYCTSNNNPVTYVVYENIKDTMSFENFSRTATPQQWTQQYLSVLYALRKAHLTCDFTHFDLHGGNVLVRPYTGKGSPFTLAYETERGSVEYLKTDRLSTIIDYGLAHIQYQGKHYGRSGFQGYSVFPDRSFIIFDCYKLLCFSMMVMTDQKTFEEATKIWRFFNTVEDPKKALQDEQQYLFSLPYNSLTSKLTLDDFLAHIRRVCDCSFISSDSTNLLTCGAECLTISESLKTMGGDNPINPIDLSAFYDAVQRYKAVGQTVKYDLVVNNFRYLYPTTSNAFYAQTRQIYDDAKRTLMMIKFVDFNTYKDSEILSSTGVNLYKNMLIQLVMLRDYQYQLIMRQRIGKFAAELYSDTQKIKQYDDLSDFNAAVSKVISDARYFVTTNDQKIDQLLKVSPGSLKKDDVVWYLTGRPLFNVL